jgi:cyclic beta-1,2-glucan synthetase
MDVAAAGDLAPKSKDRTMSTVEVASAPTAPDSIVSAGDTFVSRSDREPIRGELYGLEHLEAHARGLASASILAPRWGLGHPLLRRFLRIGRDLESAYRRITAATRRQESITPDAEWLLDNYHIVSEALREVRHDLPRGYYQQLPKLAAGPYAGFPRVYVLALELIAHTDSSLDENNVGRFVQAYQSVAPLTIGELWAVPIMLRVGLLENLHRLARQMLTSWNHRLEAEGWKPHLIACKDLEADEVQRRLSAPALQPRANWSDPFIVHLLQLLRDHGPEACAGIEWLEEHLGRRRQVSADVLRREHQRQAANQVSVGNCVTSLRLLSALDWTIFFERSSLVEAELRHDPAGIYARQDFPTKDRYRQMVERLARGSDHDERAVARQVVELAQRRPPQQTSEVSRTSEVLGAANHVGYYLVGPGRPELEKRIGYRSRLDERLRRLVLAHPGTVYFGGLTVTTALILGGVLAFCLTMAALPLLIVVALVALLPATDLAVGLIHYLVTLLLPPRVLPKMGFKEGIPADCSTFVVMPTMLVRPESAAVLCERLEIHYLSNPDPQLRFALLTDFADAPAEQMPEDSSYVQAALEQIKALNARYAAGGPDRFFLFHRGRQFNPAMNHWMGWERKRGKLMEFNRLLRGARDTSFAVMSGDVNGLPHIRFVITLDADTRLPREAARRLIATLAHPLNRPRFDAEQGRVVEGYGVLQPRVSLGLPSATRSHFARIFTGSAGLDPYTTAVSDVYQDLFGVGSYTGKGIYDVDAFEAAAGNTFPDNHILSHDLIEGNYARCGLVTDIELLDEFPAHYQVYARREHRWVRGDWQILPWLFRRCPSSVVRGPSLPGDTGQRTTDGLARSNPLPVLERWKILDNLRRSVSPAALMLLLFLGWTVLPGSPWFWTGLALTVPAFPVCLVLLGSAVNLARHGSWMLQWRGIRNSLTSTAGQALLGIVFLADQARLLLDAVVRTLYRLFVSRRHLLEWETAASTERRLGNDFASFARTMYPASALACAAALVVALVRPEALPAAAPLLLAWLVSPAVAYWVSRPLVVRQASLTPADRQVLRRLARKTWGFFERFVTAEDRWLPPDNYQEDPKGEVAHRTSPTNIGLYLLSTLAAHDFGYLSLPTLLTRLENTFDTLDQLERFHGHFYNWYDTRSLRSLQPPYVSTVDSGNLLGCLLVLKQGLREKVEEALPGPSAHAGLVDTLLLAAEALRAIEPPAQPTPLAVFQRLDRTVRRLEARSQEEATTSAGWSAWLGELHTLAADLTRDCQELAGLLHEPPEDLQRWAHAFAEQVRDQRDELAGLTPWVDASRDRGSVAVPDGLVAISSVAEYQQQIESLLAELKNPSRQEDEELAELLEESSGPDLLARCHALADRAAAFAEAMDFSLLYNAQRHLFAVGYNLSLGRLDNAHYDLLASEACLTSFLSVARGQAPRRHWFQLGRPLTRAAGGIVLLSWGGTMFEYLMPRLLLWPYPGALLGESWRTAVDRQIEYGRRHHVPWGISESGFNALDAALDYQYQSFGVPGLGLKRGLAKDLVIAPYATALALAVDPPSAVTNFRELAAVKGEGAYGFYEAIDFTRDRLQSSSGDRLSAVSPKTDGRRPIADSRPAVVRSYMAHHQGMSLVALANCLFGDPMPRRFHAEPVVRAADLLLQERVPLVAPLIQPHGDEATAVAPLVHDQLLPVSRRLTTPHTPRPRIHLLSNGRYSVMVTNAAAGSSTCRDLDVTRWREDRTRDCWGQFCYIRDLRSGLIWSAGHQPLCRAADAYEVIYSADKAEFRRLDAGVETHWEIAVSPENNAEVRRLTLTNHNPRPHDLELTSYAEVALGPHRADLAHPAFAKLFLETEFVAAQSALFCRRRPRAEDQKPIWAVHVMAVDGLRLGDLQYETDRARFLGRGRTPANPAALEPGAVLSGTTGAVLDPIFSLRRRVRVLPGASVTVAFTTAVADSREEALALADQYHDIHGVTRALELAWAHSQVELRHLHLSAEEAHLYQRLAGHVVFAGRVLRSASALSANRQGQPGLWRHGISGDKPIVLARITEGTELPLVRQLLLAHTYWRLKGLEVDLVILNEHPSSYLEELQEQLHNLVRTSDAHALADKPGGVFVRQGDHLSEADKLLLQAAARVVLTGDSGSLAAQVDRVEAAPALPASLVVSARRLEREPVRGSATEGVSLHGLLFANGWGGFTPDGSEYVIRVDRIEDTTRRRKSEIRNPKSEKQLQVSDFGSGISDLPHGLPPAPWINVVANPSIGFLISESGSGFTWAGNSQANRLTGWSNDPVADPPAEVIYLRDESTGEVWTPTPLPLGPAAATVVRHGQGYTRFTQNSHGLSQELLLFVPRSEPLKIMRLTLRNPGSQARRLSATFYAEWVLGGVREQSAPHVITSVDLDSGALLARSAFNSGSQTESGNQDAGRVAFVDVNARPRTLTGDRAEFLGRNGSLAAPAALGRVALSGSVGPALDPCAALMVKLDLKPGEEKEVVFLLGESGTPEDVRTLLRRFRDPHVVRAALDELRGAWDGVLGTVQVATPNPALNILLNRWLLHQVLSCRLWARSAFYQSGGAYGFRDQLQDVMALVYGAPREARAHLIRAAGRQFLEGDVQHWWHSPDGRGVRTRFSDDLLWLPLVACHYVAVTGDTAMLDEQVPFLRAPVLKPEQEEDYGLPEVTTETATLYEHCVRALEHGYRLGAHGLPLMGTGDWNDGMNRVGAGGNGESVWVGWFLVTILRQFAELTERLAEGNPKSQIRNPKTADSDLGFGISDFRQRAAWCREKAEALRAALEEHAWDGGWYRRAYFDDGTPLGSAQNDECQIDSIVQSWSVISGGADPERAHMAMSAVEERLVRGDDKLILLFTPPFDQGKLQPGYIKGYVPGIRENGGQYTHAAVWVVQATALLGRGTRAMELFDLLNPILHAATPEDAARYRVEPYVVAADVYSQAPHTGRGGWTWYTGSASWLYRVALETMLGFEKRGTTLRLNPCIPATWPRYEIDYRHGSATYHITIENPQGVERGVQSVTVDGQALADGVIQLADDGRAHEVRVVMGPI